MRQGNGQRAVGGSSRVSLNGGIGAQYHFSVLTLPLESRANNMGIVFDSTNVEVTPQH